MNDRLHRTRLLAFVTGLVNLELLLRNEYFAENRILRAHLPARLRLTDPDRRTLAQDRQTCWAQPVRDLAQVAKRDTILGWSHRLVAAK